MIKISEPTRQELEQGFQICPCKYGVHLLQAGFDVELRLCGSCFRLVADIDDFKTADGVRILSK